MADDSKKNNVIAFPLYRARKSIYNTSQASSIDLFLLKVEAQEYESAAETLAMFFGIDIQPAMEATSFFVENLKNNTTLEARAKLILSSVKQESHTEAISLLAEVFNIRGSLSAIVVTNLKTSLKVPSTSP